MILNLVFWLNFQMEIFKKKRISILFSDEWRQAYIFLGQNLNLCEAIFFKYNNIINSKLAFFIIFHLIQMKKHLKRLHSKYFSI